MHSLNRSIAVMNFGAAKWQAGHGQLVMVMVVMVSMVVRTGQGRPGQDRAGQIQSCRPLGAY